MRRCAVRVPGFRFAGVHCGLKAGEKKDISLIVSEYPAAAAGMFTTNRVQAAPVRLAHERLKGGCLQAVLTNSGNANAYTGRAGELAARDMTRRAGKLLGIPEQRIVPCSTGRIGVPLPRAVVLGGVEAACRALSPSGFHAALAGMMTTDAFAKFAVRKIRVRGCVVTVAGLAKGAGMIAPNMATMLAYVLTDARVSRAGLRRILDLGLPRSFNAIVVDGDMSTNDTVLLLANGAANNRELRPGAPGFRDFSDTVCEIMRNLARLMVKDGEGATKVIDVTVRGARTPGDAGRVADAIARSPLCKTAFFGGDPYAGRIVCAVGYSGARFDPDKLDVFLDDVAVVRSGREITERVERRAADVVAADEFSVTIDLHAGKAGAQRMTSDLSLAYVRLNSAYRT